MANQEMGPGKVKVKVTVTSEFIVDEDDVQRIKDQGWDDTLRNLSLNGMPIKKKVKTIKTKE